MSDKTATPTAAAPRSPFEGHVLAERPNRAGHIGVRLNAQTLASVTQASTWISGLTAFEQALARALGQSAPASTGQTLRSAQGLVVRTGPEELLIVGDHATDNMAWLRGHVAVDVGSVIDLSHARCRVRLRGDRCRDTLGKLFPIDLREPAFPIGQARLTGHHHVPCLIHRLGTDGFDLYVFSTYAHDQLSTVMDAALEFGVALQAPWSSGTP